MDAPLLIRALGALLLVVGFIAAAGWLVRRHGLARFIPAGVTPPAASQVVARLPGRRTVVRVKLDDRCYDLLLAPDHSLLLGVRDEAAS